MKKIILMLLVYQQVFAQVEILPDGPQQIVSSGGIVVDNKNNNSGSLDNGIKFGLSSGEGISSRRTMGANQFGLDFYTGNAQRMSISKFGNVGIGINEPSNLLHLHQKGRNINAIQFTNLKTGAAHNMNGFVVGIDYEANAFVLNYYNSNLHFGNSSKFQMTLTPNGFLGIGTQKPTSKLTVSDGGLSLANSTDKKRWLLDYDQPNGALYLDELDENEEGRRLVVKNGGNVGIGTNEPKNHLHLHKNNADLNFLQITNSTTEEATSIDGLRIGIDNVGNSFIWNGEDKNIHLIANGEINLTVAQKSGNVGIGIEEPPTKLAVSDGGISLIDKSENKRWEINYDKEKKYFYLDEFGIGRHFVIQNGGNIGIGTLDPSFPLEIDKTINSQQVVSEYDLNQASHNPFHVPFFAPYSMKASNKILAQSFNAFSDERHKRRIQLCNNSLNIIKNLKVSQYKFIDTLNKGNELQFGFLAQEVEKVFPEAVSKIQTEFVPDAYCLAEKITLNKPQKQLTIKLPKNHEYKVGDELKLIVADGENIVKISEVVDSQSFKIENWEKDNNKIFVFGKKVTDFRTVDYDKIFTLGIAAIQELSKEIEDLNKSHEKRISDLEAKLELILNSNENDHDPSTNRIRQ